MVALGVPGVEILGSLQEVAHILSRLVMVGLNQG
jgi:hypothetical protein